MNYIRVIVLSLIFFKAQAQNLTFYDLKLILNKNEWALVNDFLLNKGWTYNGSSEEDDKHFATITWSYGKSTYSDKAKGWVYLSCSNNTPVNVSYQFHNTSIYNSIKSSIASLGMKRINSKVEEGYLAVEYSNKTHTAILKTGTSENENFGTSVAYVIEVFENINTETESNSDNKNNLTGLHRADNGDGTYSMLNYYAGKLNGITKVYNAQDEMIAEVTFINDKMTGPYILYEGGNIKEKGTNLNGNRNGPYKVYSEGRLSQSGIYKDDYHYGLITYYYYNDAGMLTNKTVGALDKNGENDGLWKDFTIVNGKEILTEFTTYRNGIKHGAFKNTIDDSIKIGKYFEGELSGIYKLYIDYLTKEGDFLLGDTTKAYLSEIGNYNTGFQDGHWLYYDKNKKLIEETNFVLGIRNGPAKIYLPSKDVLIVFNYEQDIPQVETYYTLNGGKLFTGLLTIDSDEDEIMKIEIEIKNGKRNGVTKFYRRNGEIEEFQYSNGIKQD
jgi:antitoxin component YwqK of YwqJK toxin-antitoxin module